MTAHASFEQQLSLLDERIENVWADILDNSRLVKAIRGGGVSKALYAIYMIETFHYSASQWRSTRGRSSCSSMDWRRDGKTPGW